MQAAGEHRIGIPTHGMVQRTSTHLALQLEHVRRRDRDEVLQVVDVDEGRVGVSGLVVQHIEDRVVAGDQRGELLERGIRVETTAGDRLA